MAEVSIRPFKCPRHWTLSQRIAHYSKAHPSGCVLWCASTKFGYGQLNWKGRPLFAHRLSWEVANGPIPAGMEVCHRCDAPLCVNVSHLFLGTHAENMADAARKGRQMSGEARSAVSQRGADQWNSKLTADEVRAIRAAPGPYSAIARQYGVSKSNIVMIRTGKSWRHLH